MKSGNRLLLFFCLITGSLFAQPDSTVTRLKNYVKNISKFSLLYPQEKVYLHFDNTGYYLGETLWFKAWLVTAENNRLSPMSKVLYVDLLTPEGDVMQSQKLKVENGQANGSFLLKDSLYAGYYEVRAYTKCMMNFGEDVIFSRVFPVFDKPKKEGNYAAKRMTLRPKTKALYSGREKPEKLDNIDVTFFPEGGNLVTGLSNRLAFKAVNKQGKSIDITGTLINSKGEEVSSFSSMYRGMGAFVFYPDGEKYSAKITAGDKTVKVELPKAVPSGYNLQVNNYQSQEMQVQIAKTTVLPSDTVGVSFMCRGKVYAFKTFSLTADQPVLFTIPKDIFPSGVVQITLFNANRQILAERLAFVNHDDALQLKTEINSSYEPFSPININFQLNDRQGNPLESTFSLSVRDKGSEIYTGYSDDIRSNLLLSSELKGYIENPGYYFEKNDVRHAAALDMLLLTQGWRRYEWKKMAGVEKFEVKQGIEKGLVVEGKVLTDIGKKEKENVDVTMWMLKPYQKGTCTTDKQGNFNLALDDFYGKTELNIETRINGKLRDHRIQLNRAFSPTPKAYEIAEVTLPDSIPTYRQTIEKAVPAVEKVEEKNAPTTSTKTKESIDTKSHALKEVTVTEKKKWGQKQEGASQADIVYDVNKEIDKLRDQGEGEPSNIFDFLYQQRGVFSANLDGFNDKLSCTYMGKDVIFIVNNTLAKIAPGTEILRENFNNYDLNNPINNKIIPSVSDLDISEVESIMIVQSAKQALGYCTECDRGKEYTLIYIYTNPEKALVDAGGKRKTIFEGYNNIRQFYSPDYKTVGLPDEKDYRRTLYWNPNVKTNKDGKAGVLIYNNKNCNTIDINAEGADKNGQLIKPTIQTIQPDTIMPKAKATLEKQKESMTDKNHVLKEVTVTEKKKWSQKQEGASQADIVYDVQKELDKLRDKGETEAGAVLDFLSNARNVFSFNIEDTGKLDEEFRTIYKSTSHYMGREAIFLINNTLACLSPIDGTPRENFNNYDEKAPVTKTVFQSVSNLDMDQIESVMISRDNKMALAYCPDCDKSKDYTLIYIYTNPDKTLVNAGGKRKTFIDGFSNVRQFYSPDYKAIGLPDEKDYRRTLYWNPNVKTDKDGKATVTFYNNKTCKSLSVSSEGISKEGGMID